MIGTCMTAEGTSATGCLRWLPQRLVLVQFVEVAGQFHDRGENAACSKGLSKVGLGLAFWQID